jgi:hypothetical protein
MNPERGFFTFLVGLDFLAAALMRVGKHGRPREDVREGKRENEGEREVSATKDTRAMP